jgi:hypothetical protein
MLCRRTTEQEKRMLAGKRAGITVIQILVLAAVTTLPAFPQQPERQERFREMSAQAEQRGLVDPFRGVTANGELVYDLFPIRSTGVSTAPVVAAAGSFLQSLTDGQRAATMFPVDDPEWRKWMNPHFYVRQGVSFGEMSDAQRDAAFALIGAGLSAKGLTLTRDIMRLNHTLAELSGNDFEQYGEGKYHITVMGTPSPTEPWGWQFDGHHGVINYFVLGDQVVMTPFFAGSEPVTATSGKYAGTTILQEEQAGGLAMINALDPSQQRAAILMRSKDRNHNLTEAFRDNVVLEYAGVRGSALSAAQRERLAGLIGLFVSNMAEGHARVKMEEVRRHLDDTWFAWIGGTGPESVFYYRIHSPVVLIEFDHQRPTNLRHLSSTPELPTRQHIHSVVRTPNGNDYGKDLLRLHYAQHPH